MDIHLSDEFRLLKSELPPAVIVVADPDRCSGGLRAIDESEGIDAFILDDGFQHRQLARDLNLVLIDATEPFGFGRTLPRGLLRESAAGLRRADAVIVTRCHGVGSGRLAELDARIRQLTGREPIAHVDFDWASLRDEHDTQLHRGCIKECRALGVCGVGNPAAFTSMLDAATRQSQVVALQDHHDYTASELAGFMSRAGEGSFDCVVTTEKDWVKWKPLMEGLERVVPVYRPVLALRFEDGEETVDEMLHGVVKEEELAPATKPLSG